MIHGIGVDIVQVARVRRSLDRHGEAFAARILAAAELADWRSSKDSERFLAKSFAAKEAFAKALGTGLVAPATLRAVAVAHDAAGKPFYTYDERLAAHMAERGFVAHLSLSDEREYAVAFAVIERP
ncbi:MAG: holo-ACP synthase [Azoarcus sp.]|jgi:holo-[acyl-carrier protein] synthase|nr:holo-ACP synthase [Azoarcus sp.]